MQHWNFFLFVNDHFDRDGQEDKKTAAAAVRELTLVPRTRAVAVVVVAVVDCHDVLPDSGCLTFHQKIKNSSEVIFSSGRISLRSTGHDFWLNSSYMWRTPSAKLFRFSFNSNVSEKKTALGFETCSIFSPKLIRLKPS